MSCSRVISWIPCNIFMDPVMFHPNRVVCRQSAAKIVTSIDLLCNPWPNFDIHLAQFWRNSHIHGNSITKIALLATIGLWSKIEIYTVEKNLQRKSPINLISAVWLLWQGVAVHIAMAMEATVFSSNYDNWFPIQYLAPCIIFGACCHIWK